MRKTKIENEGKWEKRETSNGRPKLGPTVACFGTLFCCGKSILGARKLGPQINKGVRERKRKESDGRQKIEKCEILLISKKT